MAENPKITLPSGAELEVQMASFQTGHRLLKTVLRELEGVEISIGVKFSAIKDFIGSRGGLPLGLPQDLPV